MGLVIQAGILSCIKFECSLSSSMLIFSPISNFIVDSNFSILFCQYMEEWNITLDFIQEKPTLAWHQSAGN